MTIARNEPPEAARLVTRDWIAQRLPVVGPVVPFGVDAGADQRNLVDLDQPDREQRDGDALTPPSWAGARPRWRLSWPHPSYVLDGDDVGQRDIDRARPTGWRFVVLDAEGAVVGLTETADTVAPGDSLFLKLDPARRAAHVRHVLERAEAIVEAMTPTFELRYLRVPAVQARAVWLADPETAGGSNDLVIPMFPTPGFVSDPADIVADAVQMSDFLGAVADHLEQSEQDLADDLDAFDRLNAPREERAADDA